MRKKVSLYRADLSACWMKKGTDWEVEADKPFRRSGDGPSPCASSCELPVLNKACSLLEAFRLGSSAGSRLASSVQFQAVSQLPAPSAENTRE